jgi:hypothetical protein
MEQLPAASQPAGPVFFIVVGVFMVLLGSFLASDYRGLASKYIQIALPKQRILSPGRKRIVRNYRTFYAISAVIGVLMIVSGVSRL